MGFETLLKGLRGILGEGRVGEGWVVVTDFGVIGTKAILGGLGENGYPELAYPGSSATLIPDNKNKLKRELPSGTYRFWLEFEELKLY
jgi:hypothetical protein